MSEAAVVMLDLLGYKALNKEPEELLSIMVEAKEMAEEFVQHDTWTHSFLQPIKITPIFISDTICITVPFCDDPRVDKAYSIFHLGAFMIILYGYFWGNGLPFRGCLSYGQALTRDNFLAGSAVFEAASLMEQSQEAAIWCHKSAYDILQEKLGKNDELMPEEMYSYMFPRYDITLKTGTVRTRVLNPSVLMDSLETVDKFHEMGLALMDKPQPDIWAKHSASERLFEMFRQKCEVWFDIRMRIEKPEAH